MLKDPRPVTMRHPYPNYILAARDNVLNRHSGSVETYVQAGLMPELSCRIGGWYSLDRVYGVGLNPGPDWQAAIQRFNAALGHELHGDLHLVIADAGKIKSPDDFALALMAYWSSEKFDKDAFAKNGIVVILGTRDGSTVAWARCLYGMPEGNEQLALEIRDRMKGVSLTPEAVLGKPVAVIEAGAVRFNHTDGALEHLPWGRHKFERVRMGGDDGYEYLLSQVEPTAGQVMLIVLVGVLLSCVIWFVMYRVELPLYFKS